MRWANPLGFKGRIGRAQFWLTTIAISTIDFVIDLMTPVLVTRHNIALTNFGGGGEWTIAYATPIEPLTTLNWIYWGLNSAWVVIFFWLFASAVVQRLSDPASAFGGFGMFMMMLAGGYVSQRDRMAKGDLRRTAP